MPPLGSLNVTSASGNFTYSSPLVSGKSVTSSGNLVSFSEGRLISGEGIIIPALGSETSTFALTLGRSTLRDGVSTFT